MPTEPSDSIELAESWARRFAVYVHIPFCRRICPYCDFAVTDRTDLVDRYVDALLLEIDRAEPFPEPVAAIAFGGGTPSSLDAPVLERIVAAVRDRFGAGDGVETSMEANPEDLTPELAASVRNAGFDRISLGVQSFDDAVLAELGRAHDAAGGRRAVEVCRSVFSSVNVDLIIGTPAESDASWEASVRTALDLGVDHLSTYALTVERGTPLSRAVAAGAPAPDPDVQADRWEQAAALAAGAGLTRYETSNHARPGHTVGYNLITWGQGDYEAFGSGAHRHRDGVRSWNVRRVDRYVERIEAGESPISNEERLDGWHRELERVTLGLRRAAGVEPGRAGRCLLDSDAGGRYRDAGVLEEAGGRLFVRRPLLADDVARTLLALDPGDC